MENIELLAPARDLETGQVAINCGADAVYIGAARFGAREAAANPLEDLEALTRYAHRYRANVYVTLNTLLYDQELSAAERMVRQLYEMGVDALIIQDFALLEMNLPPIALFASTQMHNHTPERVAFLEQVGIRRAILARELSLEQVQAIRASTSIELETFIHGALCVSYSGRCYLSHALGGRSGNRGQCAQPCRRAYQLVDAAGNVLEDQRHLLSLRDLNLTDHLDKLLDAGVRSFKIEGRLKDKSYVMNVVGHYRQQLDTLLSERGLRPVASGRVVFDFAPNPVKTFNRGFTTYFLHERSDTLVSWDTPKAIGEPLGRVATASSQAFTLDIPTEVHPGDGLCFFDEKRELHGTSVNGVEGASIQPAKMDLITPGLWIYRNHDHQFEATLQKSQTARKIAVRMRLEPAPGGLSLLVEDEDGCRARCTMTCDFSPAEKPELVLANFEKQLRKLGGTDYECNSLEIALTETCFVPVAAINALRRGAIKSLTQARVASHPRLPGGILVNEVPYPQTTLSHEGNVLNKKALAFYQRHGVKSIEPAAEAGIDLRGRKVMTTKYCLRYEMGSCPKEHKGAARVRLQEPLALVDEDGVRLPLRFNCARCEMEVYYLEEPPTETVSA